MEYDCKIFSKYLVFRSSYHFTKVFSIEVTSSRSKFDDFITSRNINPARGRGFWAYLHSNTGRQDFDLGPISATSDPLGRQTNSSTLVDPVALSGSTTLQAAVLTT